MPKKAVAIFFLLAFVGAVIFVYLTFPRTKDEIPKSNNQRPYPSAPGPNAEPVPETVPHPNTPTLRVWAWASGDDARALGAQADAFAAATGHRASLTIENEGDYRHDLQEALNSAAPPDVCLIAARDFSGLDPNRDLVEATPTPGALARSLAAFTVAGQIRAVPDEFSVNVLFYNPAHFDRAGIGYPDRHWNWDILEADARALGSLKLRDGSGQPTYPLELTADFDLWNILCTQAGHAALDLDEWHLTDASGRASQLRALNFIQEFFHTLSVTAPLQKGKAEPGRFFAQQRASLLIAPSEMRASLAGFPYAFTLLPGDIARASLARVNGWAVTAKSTQRESALALAAFLARQPVHAGWNSTLKPAAVEGPEALCYEAFDQALLPRIGASAAPLALFLDQQINQLARNDGEKTETLYARIQGEYQNQFIPPPVQTGLPQAADAKPVPKADASSQLRGL